MSLFHKIEILFFDNITLDLKFDNSPLYFCSFNFIHRKRREIIVL